jgi:hypothetical protein
MPKGDEEEIAGRGEGFFRFVALLATRALLERPTLNPSFDSPRRWKLCLGQRAYANLVGHARSSLSSTMIRAGKCYLGIDVQTSQTRTINDRQLLFGMGSRRRSAR